MHADMSTLFTSFTLGSPRLWLELNSPGVQPRLVGVEAERAAQEALHEVARGRRAAGFEDGLPVAVRHLWLHEVLGVELAEEIPRDDERPHVRVVDRRVAVQMTEAGVEGRAVHVAEHAVAVLQLA